MSASETIPSVGRLRRWGRWGIERRSLLLAADHPTAQGGARGGRRTPSEATQPPVAANESLMTCVAGAGGTSSRSGARPYCAPPARDDSNTGQAAPAHRQARPQPARRHRKRPDQTTIRRSADGRIGTTARPMAPRSCRVITGTGVPDRSNPDILGRGSPTPDVGSSVR
jgi:hypothetical protein